MIYRILPFGVIWLVTGLVFILVETAAMGTTTPDSPTIINLTLPVILFASVAVTLVGFLVGFIEIVFVEKRFRKSSFLFKVIGKFLLYSLIMLVITFITFPIAASLELSSSILDNRVWVKFGRYLSSITFLSTLLQMASSILLCVIYAAVSENIGHSVLINLLRGKYHKPQEETRIFLFLDMAESTSNAETLGHTRYFEFLSSYYESMSDAIINYLGEVYQYIGDEVVISWDYQKGIENNNCIQCFFAIKEALHRNSDRFKKNFGIVPSFKAGIHMGEVTTGEIGALKKEIFFTGDVLNVTSRLQGLCKTYQTDFIASKDLLDHLTNTEEYQLISIGTVTLKGRTTPLEIFSIS